MHLRLTPQVQSLIRELIRNDLLGILVHFLEQAVLHLLEPEQALEIVLLGLEPDAFEVLELLLVPELLLLVSLGDVDDGQVLLGGFVVLLLLE